MDDDLWMNVRIVLLAAGGIMVGMGLQATKSYQLVMLLGGSVTVIGPAIWAIWAKLHRQAHEQVKQAVAVQAGINLAASGQMLDKEGKPISSLGTPPLPVTQKSAEEIVKNFAPPEAPKVA